MRRQFVIGVNEMSVKESRDFIAFCNERRLSYWHWMSDMWLIVTPEESDMTSASLRDQLRLIAPRRRLLVLQVHGAGWSGFGPSAPPGKNMFKWIRETWDKAAKQN